MNKKIIFMGTPEFAVKPLASIHESDKIDIALVITGKDKKRSRNKYEPTPVRIKAMELGIPTYEPEDVNSEESLRIIDDINPDFIVVIAYGQMIKNHLLSRYKDRIINIHSSLLPKYRGAAPMQFAILNKEKETGVCSMLIEKKMDTGDILDCRKISLDENSNIEFVHEKLSILAGDLIVDTILNYEKLYNSRMVQNQEEATYSDKITKDMGHISFFDLSEDIQAKIMAFSSWPGTFAMYKDMNIKIHNISTIEKYNDVEEGKIFAVNNEGIYVNSKDKCIVIKEIQFPGKKRMSVSQFLLGNDIEIGEILK